MMSTPDEGEDVNHEEALRHLAAPRVENAGFEAHNQARHVEEALRHGSLDETRLFALRAAIDDLDHVVEVLESAYVPDDE